MVFKLLLKLNIKYTIILATIKQNYIKHFKKNHKTIFIKVLQKSDKVIIVDTFPGINTLTVNKIDKKLQNYMIYSYIIKNLYNTIVFWDKKKVMK